MTKTVFIIEDNERNLKLFKAVLQVVPDLVIHTETQGDKGLELIKSSIPDLVILDIQVPKINGMVICTELRKIEKLKNIPIIAVTSFAMKGDEHRIMSAGFDEYVSKPINVTEFRELIKKYLFIP